jgi:hypothetical protein
VRKQFIDDLLKLSVEIHDFPRALSGNGARILANGSSNGTIALEFFSEKCFAPRARSRE